VWSESLRVSSALPNRVEVTRHQTPAAGLCRSHNVGEARASARTAGAQSRGLRGRTDWDEVSRSNPSLTEHQLGHVSATRRAPETKIGDSPTLPPMPQFADRSLLTWIVPGDVVVLVVLTIIGFASHSTLDETSRLVVTTAGVLVAWAVVAPWFGAFSTATITRWTAVWRVGLAWAVAAPVAGFLRGLILDLAISATFILVTIAVNGAALVVWRLGFAAVHHRRA
jgi:hypothetical protein